MKGIGNLASNRGFTLLEVMIGLAVMGGLLLTLIYTLNYQLTVAERHATVTALTGLAKEKLYVLEKQPVAEKGVFSGPYASFSFETAVRDSSFPGMAEISVIVSNGEERVILFQLIRKTSL